MITQAAVINTALYQRQGLIEVTHTSTQESIDFYNNHPQTVGEPLTGWGPYTHVVTVHLDGQRNEGRTLIARIDGAAK